MQKQEAKAPSDKEQLLTSFLTELDKAKNLSVVLLENQVNLNKESLASLSWCLISARTLLMELHTLEQKTCRCGSD